MRRSAVMVAAAVVGAALIGSATTLSLSGVARSSTAPTGVHLGTATVVRTDLVTTTLTAATLGYGTSPPVVNQLDGTYTAVSAPSSTIGRGGVLYRVDDEPVVLMVGTIPVWRPFELGMTDGTDVAELESNLIALGDASGLFSSASQHFSAATQAAVERWQTQFGYAADGTVALGEVVFLPGPIRVGAPDVEVGQAAQPQQQPFAVTTTTREVMVPLSSDSPTVTVGEPVTIVLLSNTTTGGTVSAMAPPPPTAPSSQAGSDSGGGQPQVSAVAVVTPSDPSSTGTADGVAVQVSLTTQEARGVLAVPIEALLALAEGGYALEVVAPSGTHHLVAVTTGVFTGSQVEVSGAGIDVGTKVVVAQ